MQFGFVALVAAGLVVQAAWPLGATAPSYRNPVRTAEEDEITHLPGLSDESIQFRQYSGYLKAFDKKRDYGPPPAFHHYWLVERHINGSTAPLVIWLNGGKGTSSLYGFLAENGPFEVARDGQTLKMREYSWNKMANVLYIEVPTEVGYSYVLSSGFHSDRWTNFELTYALESFYAKFPQYSASPLYFVGQGGAGAYILDFVASQIEQDKAVAEKIRGIAIGNGFLHGSQLAKAAIFFANRNGLLSATTWRQVSKVCCHGEVQMCNTCTMAGPGVTPQCESLIEKIYADLRAAGVNAHNIHEKCPKPSLMSTMIKHRKLLASSCNVDELITGYLNRADVRTALNVPDHVGPWSLQKELYYVDWAPERPEGMRPQLETVLASKIPTLFYTGELDMVCSHIGIDWFVDELKLKVVAERKPWTVDNKLAGTIKKFEGLTLVTLKDAGHSAPADAPKETFELLKAFISGAQGSR